MEKKKPDIPLLVILLIYAIIYSLISLVNHYNFRTYGWDLGLYNNALYDYSHFQWNDETLVLPYLKISNSLGDHFSLLPLLLSPLVWLFGSWTMLLIQIAAVLWGGYGLFRFVFRLTGGKGISYCALVYFFSLWGIYSALSFDYHDNVVAAMLLPWFVYEVYEKKYFKASLYLFFILVAKENMALWMFFVCAGLAWLLGKEKMSLKYLAGAALVSALYFILVTKWVIPSIAGQDTGYIHFRYDAAGHTMKEVFLFVISHPVQAFTLLFENHSGLPGWNGIKSELHFVVLFSGGIVLLFYPQFLLMLIPVYFQKLFHNEPEKWGIYYQYSVEYVPVLAMAVFYAISRFRGRRLKQMLQYVAPLMAMIITFSVIENPVYKYSLLEQARFYRKSHYEREFDVKEVHGALKKIPPAAKVSAQNMLVPHLALRDTIYYFPYLGDAEYVALLPGARSSYPLTEKRYHHFLDSLRHDSLWCTLHDDGNLLLLVKKNKSR
mgnify:CR=1 FL=1